MTIHISSTRRLRVALASVLAGGLALTALGAAPAQAGPVSGERTTISGTAAGKVKRPVTLQKYQSKAWRTVTRARTTSKGHYSFSLKTPSGTTSYRVYAPKAKVKIRGHKKTIKAWKSGVRKIAPTKQSATFTTPDRVRKSEPITTTATFRPARKGRPVVLQRLDGATWRTISSGTQDAGGRATLTVDAAEGGTVRLRAQTSAHKGAAAYVTPARTVTVEDRTVLLSRGLDALAGDLESRWPSVSRDGRWEVFMSAARNLVPQDTTHIQIYLRDHETGKVTLISRAEGGTPSDGYNYEPRISANGAAIAWSSEAHNLEDGYDNDRDVFLWTRGDGKVRRISQKSDGTRANHHSGSPSISDDGQTVAYLSGSTRLVDDIEDRNLRDDVFVWSANGSKTEIVSLRPGSRSTGNGAATRPSISGDGNVVAFGSTSTDLAEDDDNKVEDVFVHHRASNSLQLLTRTQAGVSGNGLSTSPALDEDGSTIAFTSRAGNLNQPETPGYSRLMVWTKQDDTFRSYGETIFDSSVSADGSRIAFTSGLPLAVGDHNGEPDAYLLDLTAGTTSLVSVDPAGAPANGRSENAIISRDGRHVVFTSTGSTLTGDAPRGVTQVYARDIG